MNINEIYSLFLASTGICTDTRKIQKGNLYIALKGENFNGNLFANMALENGAIAAIVDENIPNIDSEKIFKVDDGLIFLQKLAQHHRLEMKIPIISLTGSNGKTTTKELIANCLGEKYNVCYTQGNLNNHIGLPLTLLSIKPQHDLAVVEMGANHKKEIEALCKIAQPDYGYITNFGKAHLEGFGGFDGVVEGKTELYEYLLKHNKIAFINLNDSIQREKSKDLNKVTFAFDTPADYTFHRKSKNGNAGILYKEIELSSHLFGDYNEINLAAAATIALYFKVEPLQIKKAIESYMPNLNRSQIIQKSDYTILMDAYNANPSSMEVALLNFNRKNESKAVILGDMLELGESSAKEHQKIVNLCQSCDFDEIFLIGENFNLSSVSSSAYKFKNKSDFTSYLKENQIKSKYILIKGSRGMALETILDFI